MKHCSRNFALALALLASCSGSFAAAKKGAVPTLCSSDETIVFNCKIGKNTASVCLGVVDALGPKLEYRLGPSGRKLIRIYPKFRHKLEDDFIYVDGFARNALGGHIRDVTLTFSGLSLVDGIEWLDHGGAGDGEYAIVQVSETGDEPIDYRCEQGTLFQSLDRLRPFFPE